jgi:aminoglycoside phosphotransferase (APT) family kinase protein
MTASAPIAARAELAPNSATSPPGWPANALALANLLERLRTGATWRAAFEELLLELDPIAADRTMQIVRESRGAWIPLLATQGGRALLLGNALSGTAVALARCGFEAVLCEREALRLACAVARAAELAPGTTRALVGAEGASLPFAAASFDLVVLEDAAGDCNLREARRVARGELALVVQNRLAYKTNDLRRGRFDVPGPRRFLARALAPPSGERTLGGYRKLAGPDSRAFALYPHSDEFSHVVGLDGAGPQLSIGPKERGNPFKVLAQRAGLFPLLAPSFLIVARPERTAIQAETRIERVLEDLAAHTGEGPARVVHWIATRGLTAVALTEPRDGAGGPRGRWCLHVPLNPYQDRQVATHMRTLALLRSRYPEVPVPEPLFEGRSAGLYLSCERRLEGLSAPQRSGDRRARARLLADAARQLATLVSGPAATCDELAFEALLGRRFALVARHARVAGTLVELERLRSLAREALIGARFPRVLMHQDLRGKHVQIADDGSVLGYLDWGTADLEGLPGFDLMHLIVHERKQALGLTAGDAWRQVRDGALLEQDERDAMERYVAAVGLDRTYWSTLAAIYPVLVGAMAESHWDYSRPRWLHREFAL